jgi:hypothetical protein
LSALICDPSSIGVTTRWVLELLDLGFVVPKVFPNMFLITPHFFPYPKFYWGNMYSQPKKEEIVIYLSWDYPKLD